MGQENSRDSAKRQPLFFERRFIMKEAKELREVSLERTEKLALRRKIISVLLAVSFLAMASSGLLMLMNKGFAFQLKMHPVHNTFGILIVLLGGIHVLLNLNLMKSYLQKNPILALGIGTLCMLVFLYVAGFNRELDPVVMQKLNEISAIHDAKKK
jgi:hypothetical protein